MRKLCGSASASARCGEYKEMFTREEGIIGAKSLHISWEAMRQLFGGQLLLYLLQLPHQHIHLQHTHYGSTLAYHITSQASHFTRHTSHVTLSSCRSPTLLCSARTHLQP